ncbi:MAG TPA: formate/nitrite transporter family protein [Symbiobacteriaceae bacterium]|nr:formate/nitrite transporter family protein [Symbiobacteriaceae bacterium]
MAEGQNFVDLLTPPEIARKVEKIAIGKATLPTGKLAVLATLAGAFVSLGCMFYTTITSDIKGGFGITMLLGGLVFNVGLMLCSIAGSELFTGNSLMVVALASRKITLGQMLRNWGMVWFFNMVGSLMMAFLLYYADNWSNGGNLVGARALYIGASKASLPFGLIFVRGIFANLFVCLASWMTYAGRTVTDKFVAMSLPIMAFVAGGFEHSVANMYFIPYAILVKGQQAVVNMPGVPVEKLKYLDIQHFIGNLIPATLGNLVGGALLVGLVYWWIYLREEQGVDLKRSQKAA